MTCAWPARSTGGIPAPSSPALAPISAISLCPGMWWNNSELSVQQRRPGLAYLYRRFGSGWGLGFLQFTVGEGVLDPLLHECRRETSNARGPFLRSLGGARSLSKRSAAGRVTA